MLIAVCKKTDVVTSWNTAVVHFELTSWSITTKWVGLWFVRQALGFSPANHAAYSEVGSLNEAVKAVRAAAFGVLRPPKVSPSYKSEEEGQLRST